MNTQNVRAETAPMEFEGDWPGIFIRGDNALGYFIDIDTAARCLEDGKLLPRWYAAKLRSVANLLQCCDARSNPNTQKARLVTEPR